MKVSRARLRLKRCDPQALLLRTKPVGYQTWAEAETMASVSKVFALVVLKAGDKVCVSIVPIWVSQESLRVPH